MISLNFVENEEAVTLQTPLGKVRAPLYMKYCEELMQLRLLYCGKEYTGQSRSFPFEEAFANLQKQLPDNVKLMCCITCRYGNFCPVGNDSNKLFCTRDIAVKKKSDLFYYTEDAEESKKRSRAFCGICGDYAPQTPGYFTYNDYLHYLHV